MRAPMLAACVALLLAGCAGWRVETIGPPAPGPLPRHVRLTMLAGDRIELRGAAVEGDSVVGFGVTDSVRVALPLTDVARVAVRGPTPATRTANLAGGAFAGMTMIFFALAASGQ